MGWVGVSHVGLGCTYLPVCPSLPICLPAKGPGMAVPQLPLPPPHPPPPTPHPPRTHISGIQKGTPYYTAPEVLAHSKVNSVVQSQSPKFQKQPEMCLSDSMAYKNSMAIGMLF